MAQLRKAPVVYVIAALRFPQLVDPQPFAAALQPRLRDDFPLYEEFAAPHFRVNIERDTVNFVHEEIRTFHFSSVDRSWALMVNSGHVALHTNSYVDRAHFVDRFATCVEAAANVSDVGIEMVQGIGL